MMRDTLLTNRDNVADAISTRDETALNAILERAALRCRAMFR